MTKLQFTAEDFRKLAGGQWNHMTGKEIGPRYVDIADAADVANARLVEMLKDAKVFYGYKTYDDVWILSEKENKTLGSTRLTVINIEEIKRECTEHEPRMYYKRDANDNFVNSGSAMVRSYEHECLKCGAKLKARWEAE